MGGEGSDNMYRKFNLETLKIHLQNIFDFLSETPDKRATTVISNQIRLSHKRKEKVEFDGKKRIERETKKRTRTNTNVPKFLGKRIKHKIIDENGSDVWYNGEVVPVFDDYEFNDECEFEVEYGMKKNMKFK